MLRILEVIKYLSLHLERQTQITAHHSFVCWAAGYLELEMQVLGRFSTLHQASWEEAKSLEGLARHSNLAARTHSSTACHVDTEGLVAWKSTNSLHQRQWGELMSWITVGNLPPFCHNFVKTELSPANTLVLMNLQSLLHLTISKILILESTIWEARLFSRKTNVLRKHIQFCTIGKTKKPKH